MSQARLRLLEQPPPVIPFRLHQTRIQRVAELDDITNLEIPTMAGKATAVAVAPAPAPQVAPHQAGGGVSGEVRSVKTLNATILTYLKTLYNAHVIPPAKEKDASKDQSPAGWTSDDAAVFLKNVQRQEDGGGVGLVKKDWAFDDFVKYMTSSVTNVVAPPHPDDASWPLSSYFISSSHNTYLTGNQLYSDSSADAYKNVLLRGCRCIEIDVWDGDDSDSDTSSSSSDEDDPRKFEKRKTQVKKVKEKMPSSIIGRFEKTSLSNKLDKYVDKKKPDTAAVQDGEAEAPLEKKASAGSSRSPTKASSTFKEPRVLHGYTLTKEVLFRDVCTSIRDYGFVVSDLPVIVSLEVHCSAEQQEAMVHIMEQVWEGYLLPQQEEEVQSLPAPGDLRRKILVKVKYAPPEGVSPPVEETAKPVAKTTSLAASPPSPMGPKKTPAKASKIIQALSKLCIYTRGVSFKSLTQPEASMPTHIFSLSESGVKEVHEKSAVELFNHNRSFLMRAYPSGLRIGSSNLDPAVFWRKGIQIVALNWQNWDEGMMLNEGMFAGTGGYVLKPGGKLG